MLTLITELWHCFRGTSYLQLERKDKLLKLGWTLQPLHLDQLQSAQIWVQPEASPLLSYLHLFYVMDGIENLPESISLPSIKTHWWRLQTSVSTGDNDGYSPANKFNAA